MSLDGSSVLVTGGTRGSAWQSRSGSSATARARAVLGYMRNDSAAEAAAEEVRARRRRAGARARQGREGAGRRGAGVARPVPRRRPQRGDRRDPAGARDRGQALGLDDERERPRAARARARDRAVDAGGLGDRRDLEPRRAARARRTTCSSAPRRRRSNRSCATSRVELAPRGSASTPSRAASSTRARSSTSRTRRRCSRSAERTPAGRLVEPDDIAGAVSFLCSDDAAMMCGQTLVVDGGYSLPA